jgi:redox-sensitive bicupin YhaK (pirin superfamily)
MTNLDAHPGELVCRARPLDDVQLIQPRDVPLGGIRAMTVRRSLPSKERPFIGSWCFLDHYGPDPVKETGGMDVPPHPHCGLQTVSWLFRGEIEHRDSLGTHALVLPGELNLMSAGHGIAHSEVSTAATTILHGVQLWVALPPDQRDSVPMFQHYAARESVEAGVGWRVFLGELGGEASPVPTYSPLLGAELALAAEAVAEVALNPDFEHGLLVDTGTVELDGRTIGAPTLVALPSGRSRLRLRAVDSRARLLLIGGTPMESDLVMWWNFVGSSHEEIVEARRAWQAEIGADGDSTSGDEDGGGAAGAGTRSGDGSTGGDGSAGSGTSGATRCGTVLGYDGSPLPAPPMPHGRLRARKPTPRR